tara:strand:- start:1311 stop:1949 length:639 start_codon:yes stop_codon:yes gene_type:complete
MDKKPLFEFDMSISSDKKRRTKGRKASTGAVDTSKQICEKAGCNKSGKYRAPKSANNNSEFYWFCMEHVREYNLTWNFFENQTPKEFEDQVNSDKIGDRPTKPFRDQGRESEQKAWARLGISDPLDVLGEKGTREDVRGAIYSKRLGATERRAINILESRDSMTKSEIRKQYKKLVKDLHPDMNGGERTDEDRLQEVVWAWDQIKESRSFKD